MYLLQIQPSFVGRPQFRLEFFQDNFPPYAILSHRWGSMSDEVTFQELKTDDAAAKSKKGYEKIQECCARALDYGLDFVWIDTCCIDKSSSAELSEAINSMYAWYEASAVCFAYLDDVSEAFNDNIDASGSAFRKSAWFTRGWTLQELIAPAEVFFINKYWDRSPLGTKTAMSSLLAEITRVASHVLRDRNTLYDTSIGERMSWASGRVTTRIEDEAYSLMGLFGVSMPAIYGEGRKAFHRLQGEIMRTIPDHTIFAWSFPQDQPCPEDIGVLASSPRMFQDFNDRRAVDYKTFANTFPNSTNPMMPDYSITNFGLHIHLPLMKMDEHFEGYYMAFLACSPQQHIGSRPLQFIALILRPRTDRPDGHFYRTRLGTISLLYFTMSKKQADNMDAQMLWLSTGPAGPPRSMIGAKLSSSKTSAGAVACMYPTKTKVLVLFHPQPSEKHLATLARPADPAFDEHVRLLRAPELGFTTSIHGQYTASDGYMLCTFNFQPDRFIVLSVPGRLSPGQATHTLVGLGVRDGRLWVGQEPASPDFNFAAEYFPKEYARFGWYNGDSIWYTAPHLIHVAPRHSSGFGEPTLGFTVGNVSMEIKIRLSMF